MTLLTRIARKLDAWIVVQNLEARSEGLALLPPCRIQVLGQTALFERKAPLRLNLTQDVDVYADYQHPIEREFRRLLAEHGKELDPHGSEVWMPKETRYMRSFAGACVTLQVADIDAVLLSKALKAPAKNRALILEYLAQGASDRFLSLAKRYHVDLEQFV